MQPSKARTTFAIQNFDELTRLRTRHAPQGSNTIGSGLYPNIAIDALIVAMRNKLAPLNAFTTDYRLDTMRPLVPVVVTSNTAGPTVQTNATDFTAGNSTLAAVTVTPARLSATVQVTDAEANRGVTFAKLAGLQAGNLADAINDVVTALMTTGNFSTAITIGSAPNFDSSDMAPILAAAKNYSRKQLLIDGGHLAYLLPVNRESFALG
jgi:hypothetical protein